MARFRGTLHGNRGDASRLGTANSGIKVTANGWDVGVKVYGRPGGAGTDDPDHDVFEIWMTGGSHNSSGSLLGFVYLEDGKPFFEKAELVALKVAK